MQKPFNAEGLDLTFLFDATYPDPRIAINNVAAASSNAMSGFTPEQTSSLQRMISTSIGEALEPLLESLGEFLSAWKKGPQSLSINASSTHGTSSELGFETQSSPFDGSYDQLSPTDFVKPSALEPRIPAKRKASAVDEAANFLVKKNCTFSLVGKETLSKPGVKGYSPEAQVKEEPTPETLLSEVQPSSTEDHALMFLSPAPTQSDMQTASSQGKAIEESSAKPESIEGQQHLANTDAEGLQPADQSEAWLVFATSSATLKALFKDEPRMDKPCPTRDYFAEKPASLSKASNVYERSVPRLPFGAPLGCAHIIDVANTQNKSNPPIKMADIIATFLFKYSPDLLYAFLNVIRHPEFTFTRIETAGRGRRDFSIERSGLTVTCSFHWPERLEERISVEEEQYDEEALIKRFGSLGPEKMQFTCEMKPWGRWVTNSWSNGGVSRQANHKDNRRTIERYVHAFGVFIFKSGMWLEGEGVTFEGGATSA